MLRILLIIFIIYAIIQIPFIIKAYWGRRKYQRKIRDGERANQKLMKEKEEKNK
jgi:FtsZ-interacting cell division protein ZipA